MALCYKQGFGRSRGRFGYESRCIVRTRRDDKSISNPAGEFRSKGSLDYFAVTAFGVLVIVVVRGSALVNSKPGLGVCHGIAAAADARLPPGNIITHSYSFRLSLSLTRHCKQ